MKTEASFWLLTLRFSCAVFVHQSLLINAFLLYSISVKMKLYVDAGWTNIHIYCRGT